MTGKYCYGKTPQLTFQDTMHVAKEKMIGVALPSSEPAVGRSPNRRPTPSEDKVNAVAFVGEV